MYYMCSDGSIQNEDREKIYTMVKNGELYVECCSGLYLATEVNGELVGYYTEILFDEQLCENLRRCRNDFMESQYYYDYLGSHLIMAYR